MPKLTRIIFVAAVVAALAVPFGIGQGHAADQFSISIGTLAPKGSSWEKVFKAFHHSLQSKSGGRLSLRIYAGGVAGDERDVIRKMKVGQMDGGAITSIGLGQIVRPVLVLQMPGMFENPQQLQHVRTEMAADFTKQFEDAGYKFLGWGDIGNRRTFANRPIMSPDDFKSVRPWVWRDDPITTELYQLIGANGVALGLPEVLPALQTGMVDTVTATAISAVALQWFRHVTHMSVSTGEPVVGATVIRMESFNALPPDLQEILVETGIQAHETLSKKVQKEDEQAASILKGRGMKEFDQRQERAKWDPVFRKLADKLAGRVYPKALYDKVYKMARGKGGA